MQEIHTYLPGILTAYLAFLLAIASPGPNVLAVIGTSMSLGRAAGVALAIGVAAGSLFWAFLTVAGLSALLAAYAWTLIVIKVFGGVYLLWLAYKAFRSALSSQDVQVRAVAGSAGSPRSYFLRGLVIQMTNPKAALAWIAIVSLGLADNAPAWVGLAIVGGTFLLSLAIHILYALAFSTPFMARAYIKARRSIQASLGLFFTAAGIKLLFGRP